MNKASLFRKLNLFLEYRKIVKENSKELELNFGIKLDWTNRMYTVLNIPDELFEEPYNIRKADVDKIAEKYIREYINNLNVYLNSKGLNELFDFVKPIAKVDKYSYLIVLGFSLVENTKIYRNLILYSMFFSGSIYFLIYYIIHSKIFG